MMMWFMYVRTYCRLSTEMTSAIKEKLPGEVKKEKLRQQKEKERHAKTKAGAAHARKVDRVTRRMTDPSQYVGAHKHRFDEDGKGKGLHGRLDVTDVMQRSGHSLLGRTQPNVEKLSEKVLEEHFISQLDTIPVKPKPRGGICRVCKLPLESKTATVHAKCKKTQHEDIKTVTERLWEKSIRKHETYEHKQEQRAQEEEATLRKHLAVAKERHGRLNSTEQEAFAERQQDWQERSREKLAEKAKREQAQNPELTFKPELAPGSVRIAAGQSRVGNAFERQHNWAVAKQLKTHMRAKQQQLDEMQEHYVKSPDLRKVAQDEFAEATAAYEEAVNALAEMNAQTFIDGVHDRLSSAAAGGSGNGGKWQSAIAAVVDGEGPASEPEPESEPEPSQDPELVAGLEKDVSAGAAEQSVESWARSYADMPPDEAAADAADAAAAGAVAAAVRCEADGDGGGAAAVAAAAGPEQTDEASAEQGGGAGGQEEQEEQQAEPLPSTVGLIRKRRDGSSAATATATATAAATS
jgi:hypothetical protein